METKELLEHINSGLCVQVLQKVQSAFTIYVKENYGTDELRQYLYSITGDNDENTDRAVKEEFYESVRPALHYLTPSPVHDLFQKEVRASFVESEDKAISLVYNAESWLQYCERQYLSVLRRTGILNLAFKPLERQASAFYLYLKYRLENPGKFEEYYENYVKIMDYFNHAYSKISELGSTQVHADYIKPLADKGL